MQGMPRYYGPGGGLMAAAGLGQTPPPAPPPAPGTAPAPRSGTTIVIDRPASMWMNVMWVAGTASSAALAYHGYKRNNSIPWAVGWFLLGGLFWPLALPIAFAQGFAKPRVKSNRRHRRSR